jgi:hypothetical protein
VSVRIALCAAFAGVASLSAAVIEPPVGTDPINNPIDWCGNMTLTIGHDPGMLQRQSIVVPVGGHGGAAAALQYDWDIPGRPTAGPAGAVVAGPSRIITERLTYQRKAVDLGSLGSLALLRITNMRDTIYASSFGPGVYSQYDTQLVLDGTSDVRYYNPLFAMMMIFRDKNGSAELLDGVYVDPRVRSARSLTLYTDLPSQPLVNKTTSHGAAKTVVLTHWSNRKEVFEVFDFAGNPSKPELRGRLLHVLAPNGDVIYSVNYDYLADGSDLPVSVGREGLWNKTSVVGGPSVGGSISFTNNSTIIGSSYPVTLATLGTEKATYVYNTAPIALDASRPKVKVKNIGSNKNTQPVVEVLTKSSIYGLSNIIYGNFASFANFDLNISWANKTQVMEFIDPKALSHPRVLGYYSLPMWWNDGTSNDPTQWLDEALDKAEVQLSASQPITDVRNQTASMIRMIKDWNLAQAGYQLFFYNVAKTDVTGYYIRNDPYAATLAAKDAFFNGPQFIRYTTTAGYPRHTMYASDLSAVAQVAKPSQRIATDAAGVIDDPNELTSPGIVWGRGESYRHDVFRRTTRIFNGVDANGNQLIDVGELQGLYRDVSISYNDTTGSVNTRTIDSIPVPSVTINTTWTP